MTPEVIYGILGAVSGMLTIITGFIVKLQINRSKCGNGMCFDCVCDDEELTELQRVRTIRRSREQSNQPSPAQSEEYIDVEPQEDTKSDVPNLDGSIHV